MKRILFISNSARLYGAERALLTLIGNIDRKKFVPVVILPEDGPLRKELARLSVDVGIMPLFWWTEAPRQLYPWREPFRKRCEKLARLIEDEKIDIVHTNTTVIADGAIAALLSGRPHVWHLHEVLASHPEIKLALPLEQAYEFIGLTSDSVVAVSKSLAASVGSRIPLEITNVIYNGVEDKRTEERSSIRKESRINDECVLISAAGPVIGVKGYENLIEAANLTARKNGNVLFVIIGSFEDRELRARLEGKLKEYGLEDKVRFLGYRDDLRDILAEVDIHVVSSISESFSLTAVEAMAAGKPVISTRCGGPEELIDDGINGLLVPVDKPQALAEAILKLSGSPELRREMGRKGRERFLRDFTARAYADSFEKLYSGMSDRRKLSEEQRGLLAEYRDFLYGKLDPEPGDFFRYYKVLACALLKKSGIFMSRKH